MLGKLPLWPCRGSGINHRVAKTGAVSTAVVRVGVVAAANTVVVNTAEEMST